MTITMTAKFSVTEAQAVALKEMFEKWNELSAIGSSRYVAFMVDGDGNFHPNIQMEFTKSLCSSKNKAFVCEENGTLYYDFDFIAMGRLKNDS